MLSFTEQLKDLIFDVESTGGSFIQKISPPNEMILKLKGYAIKRLKSESQEEIPRQVEFFLFEEFNEGFFEEGIRVSLVHLAEMGITKTEEVYDILCKVIDKRIDGILSKGKRDYFRNKETINIDDAIVQSVVYVWEEYGSEPTILYNFAKQRFLIIWDYHQNRWKTTGLGNFLIELKPFQAIAFLLTIDLTFTTGDNDYKHLSIKTLESLLKKNKNDSHIHIIPLHRETLRLLGIIRSDSEKHWEFGLTPIGKSVIEFVLADDNPMKEVVTALILNEEQGIHFEGSEKELNELKVQLNSDIIDKTNLDSIENGITLFKKGSFIDSSRILFPSIESIANHMLLIAGENPDDHRMYPGLVKKTTKLEELKLIPTDLSKGIEIATSRNKVLHGEYEPLEQEYAYPLCIAAIIYLRRILNEYKKVKVKSTHIQ